MSQGRGKISGWATLRRDLQGLCDQVRGERRLRDDRDAVPLRSLWQGTVVGVPIDDSMWLSRAHSVGHARQHLNLIGYALMVNSLALLEHRQRAAPLAA